MGSENLADESVYIVDELHYYNGLLGSHVAFIMRRLRRICAALGNSDVKFISCSATVANPEEHFKTIFGIEDVRLVDFDGSPSGMSWLYTVESSGLHVSTD